jgi:hypothetical protein
MRSFIDHLIEGDIPTESTYLYRWVPISGYSASTMGINYGYYLDFAVVVKHPMTGQAMLADPFNPLKGQVLRPMGSSWKPLSPLKPEGKITQKVIDGEIQRQRQIWSAWKNDPAPAGLPKAHDILASIMKRLIG